MEAKTARPFVFMADLTVTRGRLQKKIPAGSIFSLVMEKGGKLSGYLVDTFENLLLKAGKILFDVNDTLVLVDLRSGDTVEQGITGAWRFADQLPDGPVTEKLRKITTTRAFLPVGKVKFRLDSGLLLDDEEKTLARFRQTVLKSGEKHLTLGVTAMLRGYAHEHQMLVEILQKSGVQSCDNFEDLYRQLGIRDSSYTSKPGLVFAASSTVKNAAVIIIRTLLAVARQNEAGAAADIDSEFLHDYRVSLRKVRSVLSLFKGAFSRKETEALQKSFAELMRPTSRLRDLDVYLMRTEEYMAMVPESAREGVGILFSFLEDERELALRTVVACLRSEDYRIQMEALTRKFSRANNLKNGLDSSRRAHEVGSSLIYKRYRKVCRIASEMDKSTPSSEVHQLRIHCKKLRYLMEFFAPFFPEEAIGLLVRNLKKMQDNLGNFNDYSVQQHFLQKILKEKMDAFADYELTVSNSIGALTAMLHQKQLAERQKVKNNFIQFNSVETRNLFKQLFSSKKGDAQ
ncbi:CHAD domain-containing protein [Desulforhopalus vacuolatus]|uniref:CHAD domain-containing protein n=1 Tax=Desulforhopalus vacuolatus TaxID=40414 RepID=UPI001962FF03|nr:CHAD domain-containing protein [Desulforhopalus vacuolatus]MBM9519553.1 CHAD domain-containing protein [Desulforhopalus vacuolatus]